MCKQSKQKLKNWNIRMRKKHFVIIALSIVLVLVLTAVLSVTVFKEELIEWVVQQKMKEYEKYKSYYVAEIPVESENFAEDFEDIHKQVVKECSLWEHKGINMDSLYNVFAKRIVTDVKSKTDYGLLVCEYIAALNIGHANAKLNVFWADFYPSVIEGRIFIDKPNEYLKNYGFCDKDEIIAINQTPIEEYVDNRKKYTHASTEEARMYLTRRWVLRSHTDSLITCDIRRNNEILTLDLPLRRFVSDLKGNKPLVNCKVLNDSIGYISIELMLGNVVEDFKQAYRQVGHYPYLIVDIRNNGGGNSNNGRLIAEYLVSNPQKHCLGSEIIPQSNAYKGKLFLLTSNLTFSAAESFTIDVKESGNAILVGEATAGDTGNAPDLFMSKCGLSFRLPTRKPATSPKGFPMEGVGIEPHFKVVQSVEDFLIGKDSVIEYVLNELITSR
ncbi:MAG: peptidase S41 [Bacteroidales bacterium]|nr:peptidase S41 [Bacteroidales bacterium]